MEKKKSLTPKSSPKAGCGPRKGYFKSLGCECWVAKAPQWKQFLHKNKFLLLLGLELSGMETPQPEAQNPELGFVRTRKPAQLVRSAPRTRQLSLASEFSRSAEGDWTEY